MAQHIRGPLPDYTPLTPREALLLGAARILYRGALLNMALFLLVLLPAVLAAAAGDRELLAGLRGFVLGSLRAADDAALLLGMALMLGNVGLLMFFSVLIQAQELWIPPLLLIVMALNAAALLLLGFGPGLLALGALAWGSFIALRDPGAFRTNPVALKEVRGRMRGARAFVIITVYLALMSGFTVLLYLVQITFSQLGTSSLTGELGRTIFIGVVGLELLLIVFITPAFTAGAITGERERKTYDLLQTTLLPAPSFVVGKLISSLTYIALLLLAAVPLQSIAFLFGGVAETEVMLSVVLLAMTALVLGALGMFFSAITERTLAANVRSYAAALVLPLVVVVIFSPMISAYSSALSSISPGIRDNTVLEAGLVYLGLVAASLNPITTGLFTQQMLVDHQQVLYTQVTLTDGTLIPVLSPWVLFVTIYLIISAGMLVFAVRSLRRQVD